MEVIINGNGNGLAKLTINLQPYLNAYRCGSDADFKQQDYELQDIALNAHLIFEDIASSANISEEVQNSPAYFYINKQFIEILKNAIDIKLQQHENSSSQVECILELDLSFMTDHNNLVNIQVSDNGTGFPDDLLDSIATKQKREESDYYHRVGSKKTTSNPSGRKLCIGGAGKGTRELMGLADKGDPFFGNEGQKGAFVGESEGLNFTDEKAGLHVYVVPDVSDLTFFNKSGGETGAVISVTTSKEPLIPMQKASTQAPSLTLPMHRFRKKAKPKVEIRRDASPVGVDQTSEELMSTKKNGISKSNIFKENYKKLSSDEDSDKENTGKEDKGIKP